MRLRLFAFPLAVLLSACGSDSSSPIPAPLAPPAAPAAAINAAQLAAIDAYVQAQMARSHVPGLALVVTLDGKPVLEKGYGVLDSASGAIVTPDSVFQIASVTKQFTASAIMLLAQDGKLQLDDPITRHLPTAPQAWSGITLRHLLNHTSGFTRDFPEEMLMPLLGKLPPPPDTLVTMAADTERLAAPGVQHVYSNVGYHLLGFVVEKVSGLHFAELLRQRVFAPLGMSTAGMISAPLPAGMATGYQWNGTALAPVSGLMATPGFMEGEGGLRMSARDLAKWDAALLGESYLSRASLTLMHTPARLLDGKSVQYGLGWVIDEVNRQPFTWHNGQLEGFRSQFTRHTSAGLSVIVLANASEAPLDAIAARVSAIVKPQLDWVVAIDPDPKLGKLLLAVVDEVGRGTLKVDDRFAPALRAAFTPEVAAAIQAQFAGFGPLEQYGYVDDVTREGVTLRRYLVRGKLDTVLLLARLDADGRLAALSFTGQ